MWTFLDTLHDLFNTLCDFYLLILNVVFKPELNLNPHLNSVEINLGIKLT